MRNVSDIFSHYAVVILRLQKFRVLTITNGVLIRTVLGKALTKALIVLKTSLSNLSSTIWTEVKVFMLLIQNYFLGSQAFSMTQKCESTAFSTM